MSSRHSELSPQDVAGKEKRRVALLSMVAAVFLTVGKLVIGLITGSLAILSEAAHSALDLVAAIVTLFAVHASDAPPDKNHTYGHGKIENISALFEALLLLLTCFWIIYEAIHRLFFKEVQVELSVWGLIIIGASILIDYRRSRALMKAAKKHKSQALEADGLHFATDMWSSTAVLISLGLLYVADWFDLPWLEKADAIAGLCVAAIVIWVSVQLCKKTIYELMDTIEPQTVADIESIIQTVPGVDQINRLRVRHAGPTIFCDVAIEVASTLTIEEAHQITLLVEHAVQTKYSGADVFVHVDPTDAHAQNSHH